MKRSRKKVLLLTAKVVVAVGLLAWVFSKTHWRDYVQEKDSGRTYALTAQPGPEAQEVNVYEGALWWRQVRTRPMGDFRPISADDPSVVRMGFAASLTRMNKALLACAVGLFALSCLVVACRWWFLLRLGGVRVSLWEVIRLTFLGLFFNFVVPGTVGGDLVKAYYASKHTRRKATVLVSVFIDRAMGLAELVLLAAIMIAVVAGAGLAGSETLGTVAWFVAAVAAAVVAAMAILFSRRLRRVLHLQTLYRRLPIAHHIAAAGEAAELYRRRLGGLAKAVCITFGAHVMWVGSIALLGIALDLQTPWYTYFIYIPVIYIVSAVPLTPGGVGLVEQMYLLCFAAANPSAVLALALLDRLNRVLCSLPGLAVALTGPKLPKADAMETELGLAEKGDRTPGQ